MTFDLSKIKYIDTHSHLHDKAFDFDRENIIAEMNKNKIATITIGTDLLESSKARSLSLANENIFYTAGLHPHDNLNEFHNLFLENQEIVLPNIENIKEYFEKLKSLAIDKKCLAIGECGLDYFYFDKEKVLHTFEQMKWMQKIVFERHIDLAIALDLPLMMHIRPSENILEAGKVDREDAYLDAINILKNYKENNMMGKEKVLRGNFHFFVSTKNVLEKILNEIPEFTISIPAVCTFTDEYDEMIRFCPLEKMHIETDSPYVLPKNRRKELKEKAKFTNKKYLENRNESNFVTDVFEKICELKRINTEEAKENFRNILKENFKKMYLR